MGRRDLLNWIRREPLVLFMAVGSLLFGVHALLAPHFGSATNPRRIVVDRADLVRFAQLRARAFSEERAESNFDAMIPSQKRSLLEDYLREEVLYREAVALGLDAQDYVIRRRLVQSLEQGIGAEIDEADPPTMAEARNWFDAHPQHYATAPTLSFTHVYFKGGNAPSRALTALPGLQAGRIDPTQVGDRFLYNANYADQTADSISSHFGKTMTEALFATPADGKWKGPFASSHGIHLVRVDRIAIGGLPPFETAKSKVLFDLTENRHRQALESRVTEIRKGYHISLSRELEGLR